MAALYDILNVGVDTGDAAVYTGDTELDRLVIQIRAARLAAQRLEARARRLTGRVLALPSGGSVRDIGVLVGLSYQRVHQLMQHNSDGDPA